MLLWSITINGPPTSRTSGQVDGHAFLTEMWCLSCLTQGGPVRQDAPHVRDDPRGPRRPPRTALDERDKGDKFERLIAAYLRNDPEWTARFSDVWLWSEWPGRDGRPDTGIDLVAAEPGPGRLHRDPVQVLRRGPQGRQGRHRLLPRPPRATRGVHPALHLRHRAESGRSNATETLEGLSVPVQRVDIGYLDDAAIDWSQYSWATPEVLVPTGKKALRPHQQRALDDVRRGTARARPGQADHGLRHRQDLHLAEDRRGTGRRGRQRPVPGAVDPAAVPDRCASGWPNAEVDIRPFAVCSDVRVGRKVNTDDADMSDHRPHRTRHHRRRQRWSAGWRSGRHAKPRMTVVFSTYQSIERDRRGPGARAWPTSTW